MFPRKGTIAVGSDADVVVFDPEAAWTIRAATHHMKADYNPYEGRTVKGVAETVLSRGEIVIDKRKLVARPGRGRYVRRAPRS
jgi:dihydropyrimidinase